MTEFKFIKAIPVWEEDKEHIMNHALEFVASIYGKKDYVLSVAGATLYLVFVNGDLVAQGPARTAKGYYRVDELSLKEKLSEGDNSIVIRCVGYNINAFAYVDVPSFLCAEICLGQDVMCATGYDMKAMSYPAKIQKTQRYSYQRGFAEAYRLNSSQGKEVKLQPVENKTFLKRNAPYGEYKQLFPISILHQGIFTESEKERYYTPPEVVYVDESYKGYLLDELECASHIEYGKLDFAQTTTEIEDVHDIRLSTNQYVDIDMGKDQTGLFSIELEVQGDGVLLVAFDELMTDGTLKPFRSACSNVLYLQLEKGTYQFISMEAYIFRYVRLAVKGCNVNIRNFSLREVAYPESNIVVEYCGSDDGIREVYEAAKLSFRANVVDIYMDCPGRERAGWLCDSFFTGRAEHVLTGVSVVEKDYLENFLFPERFDKVPAGMLPCLYPGENTNDDYINNWAMWYGLELYEYFQRTKDTWFIERARPKMEALLVYLQKFENAYGLLEKLDGSINIDASMSNVIAREHDISFPTNMLYSALKSAMGELYQREDWKDEGEALRQTIRRYGVTEAGFFRDVADAGQDGMVLCDACTEACQYYAFFCGVATPETHPTLWNVLVNEFGHERQATGKYSEISSCDTLVGVFLRLDVLARYGQKKKLLDGIKGYFLYMAKETGTLWEHTTSFASCNHGYMSHVVYLMEQLGLLCEKVEEK